MTTAVFRRVGLVGCVMFSLLALGATNCFAQVYGIQHHTYHPEHGYVPLTPGYAYGGYSGMTPQMGAGIGAGAAASGMGDLAAGLGQLHESNAQAQISHQQALTQYIKNQGLAQEQTIEMAERRNKAKQERIEREKMEEKHRIALYQKTLDRMAAAHRLTAEQFDMDRGVLHWPHVLRAPEYADLRLKIDQLFNARTPDDSGTDSTGYEPIKQACEQMLDIVKREVKNGLSAMDYVTAKHFISSIEYEARFKVK